MNQSTCLNADKNPQEPGQQSVSDGLMVTRVRTPRKLSLALVGRLARYRDIVQQAQREGKTYVSSDRCGKELRVDGTLVRKDMACIGVTGKPHVGYPVAAVMSALERLVREQTHRAAVLVGAGNLGKAIIFADTLQHHGVHLEGVFDVDDAKVGQSLGRLEVTPMDRFAACVEKCGARIGVITVPAGAAQMVADRMIDAGIRVIWNFAPVHLQTPDGTKVLNEHLSHSVGRLSRYLDELDYAAVP